MSNIFKQFDNNKRRMNWEDVGFLKASRNRMMVFREIANSERTPSQLHNKLGLHFSQVSRVLKELVERDIIICLNQESRKGKLYGLTENGKEIEQTINKLGD